MRQTVFICHAQPEDNTFASWLYFKLSALGYDVWCELQSLRPGEYFWEAIDNIIRNRTAKFLFVSSAASAIKRGGIYDEFDFARTVAEDSGLERFILLLKTDGSPANSRIGQHRIHAVCFEQSWASGLAAVIEELEKDGVARSVDGYSAAAKAWHTMFPGNNRLVLREEEYFSNWFPIVSLPEFVHFHKFDALVPYSTPLWKFGYPVRWHKDYIATFASCYDFLEGLPRTTVYDEAQSLSIPVTEIITGTYDTSFVSTQDANNILQSLLNKSVSKCFQDGGLRGYTMSNKKKAFWYPKDSLEKDKIEKVLMVGKMKRGKDSHIHWHFGISGFSKLNPSPLFVIASHIFFTEDGKKLIDSDPLQHKARRRQGKNWWNRHWKEKLLHSLKPMAGEDGCIAISVGQAARLIWSSQPLKFSSNFSYNDPNDAFLPQEETSDTDIGEEENLEPLQEEHDNTDTATGED